MMLLLELLIGVVILLSQPSPDHYRSINQAPSGAFFYDYYYWFFH